VEWLVAAEIFEDGLPSQSSMLADVFGVSPGLGVLFIGSILLLDDLFNTHLSGYLNAVPQRLRAGDVEPCDLTLDPVDIQAECVTDDGLDGIPLWFGEAKVSTVIIVVPSMGRRWWGPARQWPLAASPMPPMPRYFSS
jgi:hypothetical protein